MSAQMTSAFTAEALTTLKPGEEVPLSKDEHHHLFTVRRGRNKVVRLFDGQGCVGDAEVEQRKLIFKGVVRTYDRPRPALILCAALIKPQPWEWLLEKCTELGVSEVVPLQSQYVESHLVEQYQKKRVRFERFCIDAMKQSGSPFLPKLRPCVDLQDAVQSLAQEGLHCLAVEPHRAHEPTHAFGRGSALPNDLSQRVCLWVGPEAGWGPKDEGQLARLRAHPLTFADVVFRAETAALFFISVIRYSASDGFLSGPH